MNSSIEISGEFTTISCEGDILKLPRHQWGHPDVTFNGNRIPSAKIWGIIANSFMAQNPPDLDHIIYEARTANLFRQLEIGLIIWTQNPKKGDSQVQDNVYIRMENQRIRHLADKFQTKIAKIDGPFTPDVVEEVHKACLTLGLHPVGCVDERIYYSRNPEKIFRAFLSNDFTRLGIYFKRPSSAGFPLQLE